jgi:hypothetical protein
MLSEAKWEKQRMPTKALHLDASMDLLTFLEQKIESVLREASTTFVATNTAPRTYVLIVDFG